MMPSSVERFAPLKIVGVADRKVSSFVLKACISGYSSLKRATFTKDKGSPTWGLMALLSWPFSFLKKIHGSVVVGDIRRRLIW